MNSNVGFGNNLWYTVVIVVERVNSVMEIEKKYTIRKLPDNLENYEKKVMEQGYLCSGPVVRIRKSNEEYILTYKSKLGIDDKAKQIACVSNEIEMPLTKDAYEHLKEKVDYHMVCKTRYIIPLENEMKVELDVFEGRLKGLIFAEVEFKTVEDAADFSPPDWFLEDVSLNPDYRNNYLATLGSWKQSR